MTFVCDATAGDHFNGKYGDLQSTPLVLEIKEARLVHAKCARKDLEQEFWDLLPHRSEQRSRGRAGLRHESGIVAHDWVLLQDEKFPGVHLAFGDPYGSQTHADWASKLTWMC